MESEENKSRFPPFPQTLETAKERGSHITHHTTATKH